MELEPITRSEQIISGESLEPITREEMFLAKAAAAVSHPASRPIISTIVTLLTSYINVSCAISNSEEATNFAAEPYPGVWSVTQRSLSIVFGIPIILTSLLCFSA